MHVNIIPYMRAFLTRKLEPSFIVMFGSYQNGGERGESDIDLAFCSDINHSSYKLFLIAQQLAELIDIEVNLIDLRNASYVFQTQIFSRGTVIYSENEFLRMGMQMKAFSMYALLNEEQNCIANRINERRALDEG
ncbi:nucleotidyltransferase domain-containing protein [Halobacillus sp. A5]|uniref:type VII toxin-antitoxin system MntA family adenylyltransferase antitoxin n=1 Tax=Halobacillus sp. A5 TaxID=2880263 RepID=UPI0020A62ACD|nr:nucleotidyltransferase domain-containing protein [Halobacillus sp. A5]MCP3029143.1 nucleotidyltransferase domain-containing protein [Halobacillus sp. A5]